MPSLGARPETVGAEKPENFWARESIFKYPKLDKKKCGDFDGEIGGGETQDEQTHQRRRVLCCSPGDKASIGWNKKEGRARRGNGCDLALTPPFVSAAPAGDRELQPSSPSLQPRPASSITLPIGHLECISL